MRQLTAVPSASTGTSIRTGSVTTDVARHVDQHAVAPARLVAGDERVLDRDQGPQLRLEQLGVGLQRLAQRDDRRALAAGDLDRRVGAV